MSKNILIFNNTYIYFTADKEDADDPNFAMFRQQCYHISLSHILQPLRPGMSKPEIACCPNGHFRHVIYGIGPFITDYPEQCLLSCIIQGWCAKYILCNTRDCLILTAISRCLARAKDLDGDLSMPHTQEHSNMLVDMLELGVLWDEYGLVGNIVVCMRFVFVHILLYTYLLVSHPQMIFHVLTSMSCWLPTSSTNSSKGPLRVIL